MKLTNFTYKIKGKKKSIKVKPISVLSSGLMFKNKSPALLFKLDKERIFSIHSLFCKPFTAIWLNEKKQAVKIEKVNNWKFRISGKGRYLLEIPLSPKTTT